METQYKIALLIDAENVSKKYIKLILDEISEYGVVTYKRVYGDFTNPGVSSWKNNLMDYAMTPVFQINYTKGKNASDSAMVIDAMDILYSGKVNAFCLVTSDSDFTKLAIRLREAGMLVVGMGEQKTPGSLVAACETFKFLDLLYRESAAEEPALEKASALEREPAQEKASPLGKEAAAEVEPVPEKESGPEKRAASDRENVSGEKKAQKNGERDRRGESVCSEENGDKAGLARSGAAHQENGPKNSQDAESREETPETLSGENSVPSKEAVGTEIAAIINSRSDEEGWANLADIGNLITKRVPGFDPRNYGVGKKLKTFIESYDCFETLELPNPKNEFLKIVYVRNK